MSSDVSSTSLFLGSQVIFDKQIFMVVYIENVDVTLLSGKIAMDIELARTFLAIAEAGSFVSAAEKLHVTQSTVSARIRSLEDQVGRALFERSKAGASLTQAGTQFQKHAEALVRVWEQARLEVALPPGYRAAFGVGGQVSLWDGFLLRWLSWMRAAAPEVALRTQFGPSNVLMERLIEGTLDLAVMYTPQSRPGFKVEMLFEDQLVLVSNAAHPNRQPGSDYIYVDWGPEFQADHILNYPGLSTPGLYMELGSLGLSYLLENKGSGYFPQRIVQSYLQSGDLTLVPRAPAFSYPAYVVFPSDGDLELFDVALSGLRQLATEEVRA